MFAQTRETTVYESDGELRKAERRGSRLLLRNQIDGEEDGGGFIGKGED